MDLINLRQKIIEQNGRYDLVDGAWADTGIDYFINAGQRFLDNHQMSPKSYAWFKQDYAVGAYKQKIQNLLSVKQIYMTNSASDRWKLIVKPLDWMLENYEDYSIISSDSGSPVYYCLAVPRLAPEQKALKTSDYTDEFTHDWEQLIFADQDSGHLGYTQIWWMPKADVAGTISILGIFGEPLSADTDRSFWSEAYPETLIEATNLIIEKSMRNSEGVRDRMAAIDLQLIGVDHALVEEEISDVVQMEE